MTLAKPSPDWMRDAACLGMEPSLFFAEPYDRAEDFERIKDICRGCSVIESCLTDALESRDDWAILGGTTPSERRAMRRKAGAA